VLRRIRRCPTPYAVLWSHGAPRRELLATLTERGPSHAPRFLSPLPITIWDTAALRADGCTYVGRAGVRAVHHHGVRPVSIRVIVRRRRALGCARGLPRLKALVGKGLTALGVTDIGDEGHEARGRPAVLPSPGTAMRIRRKERRSALNAAGPALRRRLVALSSSARIAMCITTSRSGGNDEWSGPDLIRGMFGTYPRCFAGLVRLLRQRRRPGFSAE